MADRYINLMADILQQIHSQLGLAGFESYYDFQDGYPDGIPREFYEALAWQGLKEKQVKGWTNLTSAEKAEINTHNVKAGAGTKFCKL